MLPPYLEWHRCDILSTPHSAVVLKRAAQGKQADYPHTYPLRIILPVTMLCVPTTANALPFRANTTRGCDLACAS